MKLSLDKNWYKARIAQEGDLDVTAGIPLEEHEATEKTDQAIKPEGEASASITMLCSCNLHCIGSPMYLSISHIGTVKAVLLL